MANEYDIKKHCLTSFRRGTPVRLGDLSYLPSELALMAKLGRPLTKGYKVVELCGTAGCVNPAHLAEVKPQDAASAFGMYLRVEERRSDLRGYSPNRKLTPYAVGLIKQMLAEGSRSQSAIAREVSALTQLPISQQVVSQIRLGKTWTDWEEMDDEMVDLMTEAAHVAGKRKNQIPGDSRDTQPKLKPKGRRGK